MIVPPGLRAGGKVRRGAQLFLKSYARYRPAELDRRFAALDVARERASDALYAEGDLSPYELKVFSQNGEDGVLIEIFNRIGTTNRYFVEFGIQDGTEGNAVLLAEVFGWSGLFIEADREDHERLADRYGPTPVTTLCAEVTPETIEGLFASAGVPDEPDLLSIDIDGNDLYVWDAVTGYRPRVVVIEYNSGIRESGPVAQRPDPSSRYTGTGAFGASLDALDVVAARRGYRLAHTDLTGTNAFYVREDLWDGLGVARAPRRRQNFGLTGLGNQPAQPEGGWATIS
jgi:hypothetical protein